jgi:tetratricopeptide (TPR) repeat protein
LLQQSLDMLRAGDHPDFLFISLEQLAYLMLFAGDFDQAIKLVEEQGPVLERISDPWLLAHAAFQRAAVYVDRAPELAYERLHEGLPFMRSVGDRYVVILSLGHLGEIALALGKVDEAEQSFREARELSAGIGNGIGEANALSGLALVACVRKAWRDAIMHALEAVARAREIGDTWTLARALVALGLAESGAGDAVAARATWTEALRISLAGHSLPTAIDAWIGLAAQDLADASRHATLAPVLAAVRNHPALRPFTAEHAAQIWTTLTAQLNPQLLTDAEQAARLIEGEQLGAALLAYAEGRAVNPASFASAQ